MGDLWSLVDEGRAVARESAFEGQRGGVLAEEYEATLGAGEAKGVLEHSVEDVVEDAGGVEALRSLEEERELFELGAAGGRGGDATQQSASGGVILGEKEDEGDLGGSELDPVTGLKARGFAAEAVDEDAVAAAQGDLE